MTTWQERLMSVSEEIANMRRETTRMAESPDQRKRWRSGDLADILMAWTDAIEIASRGETLRRD